MYQDTVRVAGWYICISWGHFGECMFVMYAMCGCPTLIVPFEFLDHMCEADECFICVTRLYKVVDGTFVYCQVTLVSACLSCNEC